MARIISSRKKYVPVKDLVVYPSKTETIEAYLDACKERIDDRLDRNVMGDLKE